MKMLGRFIDWLGGSKKKRTQMVLDELTAAMMRKALGQSISDLGSAETVVEFERKAEVEKGFEVKEPKFCFALPYVHGDRKRPKARRHERN